MLTQATGVASTTDRTTWTIDPQHAHAEFAVRHLMISTVKGRFAEVSGTVQADEADPTRSSVEIEIEAASIDTRVEQRDQHLRSADFLDVENHPKITFRSRRIEPAGDERYRGRRSDDPRHDARGHARCP
ncbi:MAG: YceI family protein [Longimicrobiales bacterium]